MPELKRFIRLCVATAIGLVLSTGLFSAQAQDRELKVGYMKNPIQDASLDIMETWAKAHGVKLTRVPMAYSVFMEKVTATLTSETDQFDIIWHNDDWGQLWKKWLDTTDDVKGIENADRWPLLAFWNDEKKLTVVPMAHTVGTFFYRSDLVKPEEVPTTFAQLVSVSQRLQKEGKVKWGYVGGMSMNNTWFSLWWTMWANNCDILKPLFERDNDKLTAAKFEPAVTERFHARRLDPFRRVQRSQALQDRRQDRHGAVPGGPARAAADVVERNLGVGDPEGRTGGAQAARQADALRNDERRGRADRDVEEDWRTAAEHQALAEARSRGQGLRGAQARGVRPNADHAFGVLLRRVAGRAQSIFGHGDRGALRQARGHTEGVGRTRR
jgi:Bacterial extracellular solute-binding protein